MSGNNVLEENHSTVFTANAVGLPDTELSLLVEKLLPLLTTAVIKNTASCGCKCARQLASLQKQHDRLTNSVKGYKEQIEAWKGKVQTMQNDVNALSTERQKEAKQLRSSSTKIEQFTKTHDKMKKALQDFDEMRKLHENDDKTDLTAIESSQKFISEEFEKLKKNNSIIEKRMSEGNGSLQNQIREVAQELEHNVKKTANNSQYTREDCLTVVGIPEEEIVASDTTENISTHKNSCHESKQAIIDLCKELNLIIDPNKISIAHRLKKGKFSKGPRPIIVKFTSKELCREVYDLRKTCKEINEWAFNKKAKKIFINESLTPEKRRLLYEVKQAANGRLRERHGVIYVWTYRGDIYVRKGVQGAPKIRIDSQLELHNIVQGYTSLDTERVSNSALNMIRWKFVKNPWTLNNTDSVTRPPRANIQCNELSFMPNTTAPITSY